MDTPSRTPKNQLNQSQPQPGRRRGRNANLQTGSYTCEIMAAKRKVTKNGVFYATLDLLVVEGGYRDQNVTATCFAYVVNSTEPDRLGLGMLGTLGESESAIVALAGLQVQAFLVKRARYDGFIYSAKILEVLDRSVKPCVPGIAWNPPPGEYRLRCLHQLGTVPVSGRVALEVVEGVYEDYRLYLSTLHVAHEDLQSYLGRFGFTAFDADGWCTSTPVQPIIYSPNNSRHNKACKARFPNVPRAR